MDFQELIARLNAYWTRQGCLVVQPYDIEVGAGTFHPATFLWSLGPAPRRVAYVQPSRRPTDGRYGDNPLRTQHYYQYQVILKPAPDNVQELYLRSLASLGIRLAEHDVRFVQDDWESPTLGAWGLGWEVWMDSLEVTQFTYFQQVGGLNVELVSAELTYGLERIAMFLQGRYDLFDLTWRKGVRYGELFHKERERQQSRYNFEQADVRLHQLLFEQAEAEAKRLLEPSEPAWYPAYEWVLKMSHAFNMLDARGAISVTERPSFIGRVRGLAKQVAQAYVAAQSQGGSSSEVSVRGAAT